MAGMSEETLYWLGLAGTMVLVALLLWFCWFLHVHYGIDLDGDGQIRRSLGRWLV
jgi:hypothetical protein